MPSTNTTNADLDSALLFYARELDSLQTSLSYDDVPALKFSLNLSKAAVADLREYLADRVNLYRFFLRANCELQKARRLLRETLHWRATSRYYFLPRRKHAHSLIPSGGPLEDPLISRYLNAGLFYFHGTDPHGKPIAWLKLKHYGKPQPSQKGSIEKRNLWGFRNTTEFAGGHDEIESYVVFAMEVGRRLCAGAVRQSHRKGTNDNGGSKARSAAQITVMVDLKDVGLSQLETDAIPALASIYRHHYPGLIASVHVLNYGWMYAGIWAIAKRMLSNETKQKITFPSNKELLAMIGPELVSTDQGGTDTYIFDDPSENAAFKEYLTPRLTRSFSSDHLGKSHPLLRSRKENMSMEHLANGYKAFMTPAFDSPLKRAHSAKTASQRNDEMQTDIKQKSEDTYDVTGNIDEDEDGADYFETDSENGYQSDSESVYFSCSDIDDSSRNFDAVKRTKRRKLPYGSRHMAMQIGGLRPLSTLDTSTVPHRDADTDDFSSIATATGSSDEPGEVRDSSLTSLRNIDHPDRRDDSQNEQPELARTRIRDKVYGVLRRVAVAVVGVPPVDWRPGDQREVYRWDPDDTCLEIVGTATSSHAENASTTPDRAPLLPPPPIPETASSVEAPDTSIPTSLSATSDRNFSNSSPSNSSAPNSDNRRKFWRKMFVLLFVVTLLSRRRRKLLQAGNEIFPTRPKVTSSLFAQTPSKHSSRPRLPLWIYLPLLKRSWVLIEKIGASKTFLTAWTQYGISGLG